MKFLGMALVLVIVLPFSGCVSGGAEPGMVDAGVIKGLVKPIMERHDEYIAIDPRLSPQDKETYLRSGQILNQILDEAIIGPQPELPEE